MTQPIPQGYKQTEIGVIPEDWEVFPLNQIVFFENGDRSSNYPSASEFVDFGVPFINAGHVSEGSINSSIMDYIPENVYDRLGGGKVIAGDLVFCLRGSLGKFGIVDQDFGKGAIASSLVIVRPNTKKTSTDFISSYFKSEICKKMIDLWAGGAAQPNLGAKELGFFLVPTPPKPEQTAIATALSDVDALISVLESLIAKKQAIKTATMQQLLTGKTRLPQFAHHPDGTAKGYQQTELGLIPEDWGVMNLGEVAHINMGQSPSSACYNDKAIGLPLVQGNADITNRKTIVRNYTSQITKTAQKGDFILSVRAPVGEVAKADFDCCIGRGVCSLKYKNDYLYHWLIGFETEWDKFSKGSTFDSINSDELRLIQLILPSDEEQTAIATILSDMDEEIQALETRLNKTKQIKQGMMQVLLTGKVRLV